MKTQHFTRVLMVMALLLVTVTCKKTEYNPFDLDCPKELFTPSDFKAEQLENSVKLSWKQANLNINGFVIKRSDNNGTAAEVARVDKSSTNWSDTKVIGGVKYDYELFAYAGANVSNSLKTSITTPGLGPVVTTNPEASEVTANSAVVGGNVTSDGGFAVTARGICYATTQAPTTSNSKVAMGTGTGVFSGSLTGLETNTTYYARAYATNSYGTSYGSEISFKTPQLLAPVVTTSQAVSITAISAVLGGNVTSDGNNTVTEYGVCLNTQENPTTANTKVVMGSGKGTYSKTVEGMKEGTTYYARAYAINSIGISYGEQIVFTTIQLLLPTVTTSEASNIGSTTVDLGGDVKNDGNAAVTERGICYGTNESPTTSGNKMAIGSGSGVFSGTISSLTPSTTYYARAYAINSKGTAYGNQVTFKTTLTISLATLTTANPLNVTGNSAELGGTITSDGYSPVTERGICIATTQNPTVGNKKVTMGTDVGTFSNVVDGLVAKSTYYVRAFAINGKGTAYGNQVSFNTLGDAPTVTTRDVSNIQTTTAIAGGIVVADGGASVTERGICYGTATDPTIYDTKVASGNGTGSFNVPLSILIPNTTYYVRAYATNSNGTAYGASKSFKTADAYYEGFENGYPLGFAGTWFTSSDSPFEGFYCIASNTQGQYFELSYTTTSPTGGQISFYHKRDGEWSNSETRFYVDGVETSVMRGEGWTYYSFTITAGTHKYKWENTGYYRYGMYIDYIICTK